ncbi:MAG TPA: LacI family DNA-binding transcriptional regulator [Steroidobacteraceae bacterium]|nr:LacI family DNA-binding transcriptional regulator [Steroidobacteraceae bacterium]
MKRRAPRTFHGTPTISDVARELGISVATVSRALSRPELLRADTRERVLAMVERLGYRPNVLARGLRRGKTHAIVFVVPNLSPFFLEIYAGAEDVARAADFALLLGSSNGDPQREEACFDQVTSGRADGIILLTGVAPAAYAAGRRALPPLVSVLERLPEHSVPVIRTDHRGGATEAVRHLIELGHRRIAHIAGARHVASSARRLEGYRAGLEAAGLAASPELLYPGDFTMQSGAAGIEKLLRLDEPPTAVLCANDEMAFGAIRMLNKRRLSVPEDLSIVGFDDQNLAAFYNPPLTTVHIPRHELGRRAALELIKELEGREGAREVVLPTRLVIRESTAPPRRGDGRAGRRRRYRDSR